MDCHWFGFDTETTGVDVETDMILSLAATTIERGGQDVVVNERLYFLDWGIPIPPDSQRIHGLSQEWLAANGRDPASVLEPVCNQLAKHLSRDTVLVGMNLVFDLTMLDRNCRRLGIPTLTDRLGDILPVVDCFVLDKLADPYRKGKRNLEALAEHYRVPWDIGRAHGADFDALAAARVCWRIGQLHPQLAALDPLQVHAAQQQAKAGQDASFAEYLVRQGKDPSGLDGQWPIRELVAA